MEGREVQWPPGKIRKGTQTLDTYLYDKYEVFDHDLYQD